MSDRYRSLLRTWMLFAGTHAVAVGLIALLGKLDLAPWLRDPLGVFSVFTLYGPIALVTKLGATRSTFERAAWLFGELEPAGWTLVIASWLALHAVLATGWVVWRRGRAGATRPSR